MKTQRNSASAARRPVQGPGLSDRARLIRLVHVARRDLRLDDGAYRTVLQAQGGAASSAEMSVGQLQRVLDYMKAQGFKVKVPSKSGTGPSSGQHLASDAASRKARAMWLTLHAIGQVRDPSEAALIAYAKRQCKVDRLEWVSDAIPLLESLKAWLLRSLPGVVRPLLQNPVTSWAAHMSPAWAENWTQARVRLDLALQKGNVQVVDEWVALWELVTLARMGGNKK